MRYFRIFLLLAVFAGSQTNSHAQNPPAARPLIKRTYYDYAGRQLHEEFQYIRTANQLVVKNGYYKSYTEAGVIKARATYRNDELDGTVTTYENWGNGPEPFEIDHYKNGQRHGYSALWWFNDAGKRLLEREGSYYHGQYDGRWVQYEHDGSKLMENWRRGTRHGETIQYGTAGQKVREGYFNEGEPFSGTLEERFDNGQLSSSIAYEACFREGTSRAWYPNGRLKSVARYVGGTQRGPVLHFLETGGPDAVTKTVLPTLTTDSLTTKADSVQQVREKAATRAAVEAEKTAYLKRLETTELMNKAVYALQDADHFASESESSSHSRPVFAHARVYNLLELEFRQAKDIDAENTAARRLLAAMKMAQALYNGQNPELRMALSKEDDPSKMLTMMGI